MVVAFDLSPRALVVYRVGNIGRLVGGRHLRVIVFTQTIRQPIFDEHLPLQATIPYALLIAMEKRKEVRTKELAPVEASAAEYSDRKQSCIIDV